MKTLLATIVLLPFFALISHAQYPNHAVSNTGFSLGLSGDDGRWSYYLLTLTSAANGAITGSGMRSDVGPGAAQVFPTNQVPVNVTAAAKIEGPIVSTTNSTTFTRRIGQTRITLTNQVVADAAFLSVPLDDGGLIKGAFVYNYNRTQTVKSSKSGLVYGWKTNSSWYGGQVFGSYNGLTGSTFLGE